MGTVVTTAAQVHLLAADAAAKAVVAAQTRMALTQAFRIILACFSSLGGILAIYAALGAASYRIIRVMARRWQGARHGEQDVPYGPSAPGPRPCADDIAERRPVSP